MTTDDVRLAAPAPTETAEPPPPQRRRVRVPVGWLMVAPNLVLIGLFLLVPLVWALIMSFQAKRSFGPGHWSGLENLGRLLGDGVFWRAMLNTGIFTLATVPLSVGIGLGLALLMNDALPGRGFFRTIVYLPIAVSTLVTSLVGLLLFDETVGIVNGVLRDLGLGTVRWQSEGGWAMVTVAVMTLWSRIGFGMLVYLAALQDVDKQVLEAAEVDGAGPFARVRHVVVPWLRPTTFFLVVINLIWSFQVFDIVYVMTNGGPGYSTTMLVTYAYDEGFGAARNFGYGATVGLVLFVLTLVVTAVQLAVNRRREV
ncbi:sugar ABC transporter permease [Luteipulveratus sp. YIM 133132]|uniref:carbohydrate ABC transporter permease n=1 Tax=Luteipulveratus flavus TaxID=3031728 RepID=UPI0023AED587|nr:sugar ABC transporter permease [Luteipulveratus sp. YIM 133132]MDE9364789.1 sugar ABC transporter permease [Luteipulveratus sp. YIM 133132]